MEQLQKALNKVFYEDGSIKLCGRDNCIELLKLLEQKYPDQSFGDRKTGILDKDKFKERFFS